MSECQLEKITQTDLFVWIHYVTMKLTSISLYPFKLNNVGFIRICYEWCED